RPVPPQSEAVEADRESPERPVRSVSQDSRRFDVPAHAVACDPGSWERTTHLRDRMPGGPARRGTECFREAIRRSEADLYPRNTADRFPRGESETTRDWSTWSRTS